MDKIFKYEVPNFKHVNYVHPSTVQCVYLCTSLEPSFVMNFYYFVYSETLVLHQTALTKSGDMETLQCCSKIAGGHIFNVSLYLKDQVLLKDFLCFDVC